MGDAFLANLEAHVVAKAQRRLREHEEKVQRHQNIEKARKAMASMLEKAEDSAQQDVEKEKKKHQVTSKAKSPKKTFTWDELQRGADAPTKTQQKNKVNNLLDNLKRAPKLEAETKTPKATSAIDNAFEDEDDE